MRPQDTQGNFNVQGWEAITVDGILLIQGKTYKRTRHSFEFELPVKLLNFDNKSLDVEVLVA